MGYLRRAALVITITAALAIGGGASALAGTDLGTVDGTTYLGDTSSGTPPASATTDLFCPDGTRPVGAGFLVNPPNRIYAAYPADLLDPFGPGALDSVRNQAWLTGGLVPELDGYAVCRTGPFSYRFDEGTLQATPSAMTLTARCPDNRHVLGGGAAAGQGGSVAAGYVSSSFPIDDGDRGRAPDDGWRAKVYGSQQDAALAVAACAKTTQRYGREVGITENYFGVGCKEDEHLLAMGARISGEASEAQLLQATPSDLPRDVDDVPDDHASFRGDSTDPTELNKRIVIYSVCG